MTYQPHPLRIQRKRTKGWKMPEGAICATRPSLLGNPWIGQDAIEAHRRFIKHVVSGVFCLKLIERDLKIELVFRKPIDGWKDVRKLLMPTHKLTFPIGCFCPLDRPCHVDNILNARLLREEAKLEAAEFARQHPEQFRKQFGLEGHRPRKAK